MIDEKGRLFKRVSVVDLLIVLAFVAVLAGFVYRQMAPSIGVIIRADERFYVTVQGAGIRHFIVDAVEVGDVMYRRHSRQPIGRVVDIRVETAYDVMLRTDGTAVLAPMEGRYDIFITMESAGSIRDERFLVGGNDHIARGSEIELVSNRVFLPTGEVYFVGERP
ncbi:MAG: DUF4330 domain-containing protein [Defluviitaleaceae bacterium]|nr:DUF4330 domain-containing protein [Defluviitaleaceae bacterium]